MKNNQFFYEREIVVDGNNKSTVLDSFNLDMVVRTFVLEDGQRLVLLNDVHQRHQQVPIINKKNEVTGYKKELITVQSEIYLSPKDSERFVKLYN